MSGTKNSLAFLALCAGLATGWDAQAFQAPVARQPAQKNALLHNVLSYSRVMFPFLGGELFFVTVESDFSAEQNGIDRDAAEQKIASKVYDFLAPIIQRYSHKPAVFLRPEPRQPVDFPAGVGIANVRVYVHSNVVLSEKPYYQTSLSFRIFWMVGSKTNPVSEDELFMTFSEEKRKPPYYYQCNSMNDCYNDLIDKNIDDGLRNYFKGFF